MLNRRSLITGLVSFVATPAIVKVSNIMPVKSFKLLDNRFRLYEYQREFLKKLTLNSVYGKFDYLTIPKQYVELFNDPS